MKKALFFCFVYVLCLAGFSQTNLDFESGNFTGWTGRVGNTSTPGIMTAVGSPTIWTQGVNANLYVQSYHTITTGASNDPYGPFPVVAPGGNYSARLGNMSTNVNEGSTCSGTGVFECPGTDFVNGPVPAPFSGAESLEQTFMVTAANAMVTLQYAAVFNNGTHSGGATVNPFFRAEVLDAVTGNPISPCLTYTFVLNKTALPSGAAQSPSTPCWYPAPATSSVVVYMPWQKKIFDLTSAIGTSVTVRFSAGGCDEGGHFGYAYIDASAGPKQLIQSGGSGCSGPITLTGPTQYGSTYTWSGPPGGIIASSANSATVNTSGTYSLAVGTGSCAITFTTTVSLTTPSITVVPASQTICSGASFAGVTFTTSPAAATVSWTNTNSGIGLPTSGSGNISGYVSPTVTTQQVGVISATPSYSGCTGSAKTFTFIINPYPNLSTGSSPTITCSSATVNLTGSSTTPGTTYAWSPGGSAPTSTSTAVSSGGTYTLTASVGSCSTSSVITVSTNTIAPDVSANGSPTITCSATTATLTGTSGVPGGIFAWTGPTTGTPAGTAPATATTIVTAGGTYTLTLTDPSNGCKATAPATISTNTTQPNANAGASPTITCSNATVTLNGSSSTGGATYSWTGPATGNPAGSTPTNSTTVVSANGNYTLTVTNPSNGCTKTASVTVNTNTTAPNASAGSSPTITCSSATVTLNGNSSTPGATYSWTGPTAGNPAGSAPTSSSTAVSANGTYTLSVTDPANGCSATSMVSVNSNTTLPQVSAGSNQTLTCASSSVTISGSSSTPGATYAWTGPSVGTPAGTSPNSASTDVSSSGTYTLTVTDPVNGCQNAAPLTVSTSSSIPQVSAGANPTITCAALTAVLTGSSTTAGATFAWTGPGTATPAGTTPNTFSTSVTTAGVYTLTVTDPVSFCQATYPVSVISNTALPNVNAGSSQTITCTSASVTLNGSSTTGGVTYSWEGPSAGSPAGSAPTASATSVSQGGTYTLTVTDPSSSCTNSAAVSVTSNTTLPQQVSAGASQTITCSSTSVTLTGSSTTSGVSYSWTGPSTGMAAGTTPTTYSTGVSAFGTYTLTVTDPVNGCQDTASTTVYASASLPQLTAGPNQTITCASSSVTLTGSSTTGGVTYSWEGPSTGTPAGSAPTTSATTVSAPGVYTITITDLSNGCAVTQQVSVSSNTTVPVLSTNTGSLGTTITCANSALTFTGTATGNSTITWAGPSGPVSGNPATVSSPGVYTVTATDNGSQCQATATIAVTSNTTAPGSSASTSADTVNCANPSVSFTAASTGTNVSYSWGGPGGFSSSSQNPSGVNVPGTYTLTVTDNANGCMSTSTLAIVQGTNPAVSFTANPTSGNTPLNVNFTNTSTGGFTGFSWDLGNQTSSSQVNASATYTATGTYTVILTGISSSPACNDTAMTVITVTEEETIEVPNIFTPNGDHSNDAFYIHSRGYKDLHVDIFNRWGQLLATMDGIESTWDGTSPNGEKVPDGTYYYLLKATSLSGKSKELTGFITLLR